MRNCLNALDPLPLLGKKVEAPKQPSAAELKEAEYRAFERMQHIPPVPVVHAPEPKQAPWIDGLIEAHTASLLSTYDQLLGQVFANPTPAPKATETDADGWVEWNASEMGRPPLADGTLLSFRVFGLGGIAWREGLPVGAADWSEESDIVAYRVVEHAPASETEDESDGWIKWGGGRMPVSRETRVAVRFRDGDVDSSKPAGFWTCGEDDTPTPTNCNWKHSDSFCDIVAYRVIG